MLAAIRRFRLLALIALFASPGVGGVAVQLLHQCPVANAAPAGSHEQCHCIGECCPAAVAVAPLPGAAVAVSIVSFAVAPVASRDGVPSFSPSRFLPPATAPPAPAQAPLS